MTEQIFFEPCQNQESDARTIMDWRNDPVTLSMFFHRTPKKWPDFWQEYRENYLTQAQLPVFATFQGKRIGFLKFDPAENTNTNAIDINISINISPLSRNKGMGSLILMAANAYLQTQGVGKIYAEIRVENKASAKAFEKAGYQFIEEATVHVSDTGEDAKVLKYVKSLKA